jgi:pimeloyl-ACP methyl ester carboxylesterase
VAELVRGDLTLHYRSHGPVDGPPFVMLHGLLWSSHLQERVARQLGAAGRRVVLLDLHGHGLSSKPVSRERYTWDEMVADVWALLDELELESAAVGGLSLGAMVALAAAQSSPGRVSAMVLEMPVLLRGHRFGRPVFSALATAYQRGGGVLSRLGRAVAAAPVPDAVPELMGLRDVAGADPRVASAVLRGLLSCEVLPEDEESLRSLTMPALVIGHPATPCTSSPMPGIWLSACRTDGWCRCRRSCPTASPPDGWRGRSTASWAAKRPLRGARARRSSWIAPGKAAARKRRRGSSGHSRSAGRSRRP